MPRGCCARLVDALCPCFRSADSFDGLSSSKSSAGMSSKSNTGERQHGMMSLNVILTGECGVGKTSLRNRWVDGVFTGDVAPTFGVDFNIKTLDLIQDQGDEGRHEKSRSRDEDVDDVVVRTGLVVVGEAATRRESVTINPSRAAPSGNNDELLQVKINVYDTSGKPGYREVNSTYLLAFDAVVFVYDISAMRTLHDLRRYFDDPEHGEKLAERRKAGMAMILVGNKCDLPLSQRQVGSQTGQDVAIEFGIPFMEVSAKSGANVREAFMSVATKAVGEHLAHESRKSGSGGVGLKRTGRGVHGLQRALRAKASVLDLFKGMTTRHRKYVQRTEPEALLLASPPEEEKSPSFASTATARLAIIDREAGAGGTVTADVTGDEPARSLDDRRPLLMLRSSPPTRIPDPRSAAAAVKQRSGFREHSALEIQGSSATRTLPSPAAAAAAGEDRSRSRSLVYSQGHRAVGDVRTSPGRGGVSPIGRPRSPHEFDWRPTCGGEKRSYTVTGRGTRSPDTTVAYAAYTSEEPFRTRPPQGAEAGIGRSRPSSPFSPRRSRGPVHSSPRAQLSPRRDVSPSPRAGGGGGGGSLSSEVDGGVITTGSAGRSLREASSFWLDQWGIKEERTDATRERRVRIRGSSSLSPRIGTYQSRLGRPVSPHTVDSRALGGR